MIKLKPMLLIERLQKVKCEPNEPFHFAHIAIIREHWFGKKCFVWNMDDNKKVIALQSWDDGEYVPVDLDSMVWTKNGVEFDFKED